jgi:hypothetical protein
VNAAADIAEVAEFLHDPAVVSLSPWREAGTSLPSFDRDARVLWAAVEVPVGPFVAELVQFNPSGKPDTSSIRT